MKPILLLAGLLLFVVSFAQSSLPEKPLQDGAVCMMMPAGTQPKTVIRLRCHGSLNAESQPLIILDGVPLEQGQLASVNPNGIQSITVLKNAEALALCGSRAVNGVILITTKPVKDCRTLLLDETDSLPVHGATITFNGIEKATAVESNKHGVVLMPILTQGRLQKVNITSVGYLPFNGPIRFDSSGQTKAVYLRRAYKKLDRVVITGYDGRRIRCGGCGLRVTWIHDCKAVDKPEPKAAFSVWPNPVSVGQVLTASVPQAFAGNCQVLSSNGQVLLSEKRNSAKGQPIQLVTNMWPAGVYFLRLTDGETGKTHTQKFILQ